MRNKSDRRSPLRPFAAAIPMLLLVVTAAWAQPGTRGPRPEGERGQRDRGGDRMARIVEFLDLTAEQQGLWKAAHEEHRASIEPLFEQMKVNQEALQSALDTDQPDALEVGEMVIAGKGLREQIEMSKEALDSALQSILDAEQLTKWEAFQEARGGRDRGPRGHEGRAGRTRFTPGGFEN